MNIEELNKALKEEEMKGLSDREKVIVSWILLKIDAPGFHRRLGELRSDKALRKTLEERDPNPEEEE